MRQPKPESGPILKQRNHTRYHSFGIIPGRACFEQQQEGYKLPVTNLSKGRERRLGDFAYADGVGLRGPIRDCRFFLLHSALGAYLSHHDSHRLFFRQRRGHIKRNDVGQRLKKRRPARPGDRKKPHVPARLFANPILAPVFTNYVSTMALVCTCPASPSPSTPPPCPANWSLSRWISS